MKDKSFKYPKKGHAEFSARGWYEVGSRPPSPSGGDFSRFVAGCVVWIVLLALPLLIIALFYFFGG